ncbi:NAD(P)-dependent alcohol dehydrogenase [Haliscomenobacter sp.]|uniref:NAD(P)-dependent alcohol dehydrogenase n=1 Tax=Haliscomenobacter sp. TaxID=2717303 RepID=UPI00359332EA
MKAVIINKYGATNELKLVELPQPSIKPNEVLVKNHYTSVNPWDYKVRNGSMKIITGNKFPKILGTESAGVIEQVGHKVKDFKKGDRVIAIAGIKIGTYAEFVAIPESSVAKLPDNVSFGEGATLPVVASTAFNALHVLGKIKKGDEVLINGAYGGVGIAAVQLAKLAGANVTAICSTQNIKNVEALGANKVIDYTKENVYSTNQQFDIVFDTVSNLDFNKIKAILKKHGVMINTLPTPKAMLTQLITSFSAKKFKSINNNPTPENIALLAKLVAEKKLRVIVDREYTLDQLSEAHQYSETGKAKGKILVKI